VVMRDARQVFRFIGGKDLGLAADSYKDQVLAILVLGLAGVLRRIRPGGSVG
jgi:hypothetical protein